MFMTVFRRGFGHGSRYDPLLILLFNCVKSSRITRSLVKKRSRMVLSNSGKLHSALDSQVHSCSEMISISASGSAGQCPEAWDFFGDSNIVVMAVGKLSGRQIATVWPDTKLISIHDPEVVFS